MKKAVEKNPRNYLKSMVMCVLLVCLTVFPLAVYATEIGGAYLTTAERLEKVGFTPVEKKQPAMFTPLSIDGLTVYAMTGENGHTSFFLYGTLDGKKEYLFPANVFVFDYGTETETLVVELQGNSPATDKQKKTGKFKIAKGDGLPSVYPEGFTVRNNKAVIQLDNIYGEKEYYVYGVFGEGEPAWFKAEGADGSVKRGSLAYVLEEDHLRARPYDVKKKSKPKEYKDGVSQQVWVDTTNGFAVKAVTAFPSIDYEALVEEIRQEQATKTGTFSESVFEDIPFETEYKKNKNRYEAEGDVVVQEGVVGRRETVYRVTYKDGVETKRVKESSKTVVKPVKEIVERGTKAQEGEYVFGANAEVVLSVDTEFDKRINAEARLNFIGRKPDKSYTCELVIRDENGTEVARSNDRFPSKVTARNLAYGAYTVSAKADCSGDIVFASKRVYVSEKVDPTAAPENTPSVTEKPVVHEPDVQYKTVTVDEAIPFTTEYVKDANMFVDEGSRVDRNGVDGVLTRTYVVTYTDGVETNRELMGEKVSASPVSKIVREGTKEHVFETREETVTQSIPFDTVVVEDGERYADEAETVIVAGSNGVREIVYSVSYKDGVETARSEKSSSVKTEPVSRTVSRGTKQHVITYGEVTVTEDIPFSVRVVEFDMMDDTCVEIATPGVLGKKELTYKTVMYDGEERKSERVLLSERVVSEPVTQKEHHGTFHTTTSYETVSISPSASMKGTRDSSLDGLCSAWAMNQAKNWAQSGSINHSSNGNSGYGESVGGWGSVEAAASGAISHVPFIADCEFWGMGCVKVTRTHAYGNEVTYVAVAQGSGRQWTNDEVGFGGEANQEQKDEMDQWREDWDQRTDEINDKTEQGDYSYSNDW